MSTSGWRGYLYLTLRTVRLSYPQDSWPNKKCPAISIWQLVAILVLYYCIGWCSHLDWSEEHYALLGQKIIRWENIIGNLQRYIYYLRSNSNFQIIVLINAYWKNYWKVLLSFLHTKMMTIGNINLSFMGIFSGQKHLVCVRRFERKKIFFLPLEFWN